MLGCSQFQKTENELAEAQKTKENKSLEIFSQGNDYLDKGLYKQAKEAYEKALKLAPSTSVELLVLYNLAAAYNGLEDCKAAGRFYRKVVILANPTQQRLKAEGLYALAKAYECVGREDKMIATLMDLEKRKQWLSQEVANAEIPARLAVAYSRRGNTKLAEKYFKEAEKGLSRISSVRMEEEKKRELLARTLFVMGHIRPEHYNESNYTQYAKSLEYVQEYLLRAVELDHNQWSARAAEALLKAYQGVWDIVKRIKMRPGTKSDSNLILVQEVLTNIELLKRSKFPGAIDQEMVKVLFAQLHKKELEFQNYLAENSSTTQKTQENESRFGIKRKGRLIGP